MIAGWILVVLQSTAPYVYGWQPIGNFAQREECEQAIVQLQTRAKEYTAVTVRDYICVRQSRSSN
jgi:hypothetical protein